MKKSRQSLILLFIGIVTIFSASAQSQFDNQVPLMSPTANFSALAGYHGGMQVSTFYSDRLHGFRPRYNAVGATVDYYAPHIKSGFGLNYSYSGTHFSFSNLNAFFNHRFELNQLTVMPSLSVGMRYNKVKNGISDQNYRGPAILLEKPSLSVGLGLATIYKGLIAAVNVGNLNQPMLSAINGSPESESPIFTQALLGYSKKIGEWSIAPSYIISRYSATNSTAETNMSLAVNMGFKNLFLSASYTTDGIYRFGGGIEILDQIRIYYACPFSNSSLLFNPAQHIIGVRWNPSNAESEKHRLLPQIGIL